MEPKRRIECKVCRGLNDPSNQFCEYCGGSLREQGYKESGRSTTGRVVARSIKRLIFVVAIIAVLAGVYYAVDRFLLPALHTDAVVTTTSTTRLAESSTTTVSPRNDRLIAGSDRYATAIAISKLGFTKGASALVLAAGDTYSEAICAAPLAAAYGGPVLLVPPEGIGGTDLSKEIQRLNPTTVFLVGVSRPTRVRTQLRGILQNPTVTNLAGDTPYATAALIAAEVKTKLGTVSKVVVAPSDSFAEALAVAPLAAAKGWPILLSPKDGSVPAATTGAIKDLGATSALVVGTSAKLTLSDVVTKTGTDSYETCALLAAYSVQNGLSYAHTAIATGEDFPDGLAAAPYLALDKGVLLLSKPSALPTPVLTLFNANSRAIRNLDFIGLRDLAKTMAVPGATTTTTGSDTTTTTTTATTG